MTRIKNKIESIIFYFKPRKVVAQYKLFFGDEWLELSVDSIAEHVYKILFIISDIPWGDDQQIMGDDLNPIIEKLRNKYGDKIIVYKGAWSKQLEHVQAGLSFIKQNLPEASHCLYIDSDEIYPKHQIVSLTKVIKNIKFFNRAIKIRYNAYFKTIYYKIIPEKWPKALVLFPLRKYINYYDVRSVNAGSICFEEFYFEHFSYVRKNDLKIKEKLEVHRETEPIMGDWFNNVWLKWTPDTHNFHPTNPEFWETTIRVNKEDLSQDIINTYLSWNKNTDEK